MKGLNIEVYVLFILLICFTGCESILNEDPPGNISDVSFYQSEEDAIAGLYGAYSSLYGLYNANYIHFGEMNADDATISPVVSTRINMDEFNYSTNVGNGLWSNAFRGINRANEVILYTDEIDFDAERKVDIIAEAKALRAIYYFNLVRAFGGVPLYEEPTQGFDSNDKARATADETYNLILNDLIEASDELPSTSSETGRINSNVADAFLARINLYRGDFATALEHARNVINSGNYELFPDYKETFKEINNNGIEHIFQIQYLSNENNNTIPNLFATRQAGYWPEGTRPGGGYAPSSEFIAENPDSYRKSVTIADSFQVYGSTEVVPSDFTIVIKFEDRDEDNRLPNDNGFLRGVNQTIIRYADILLIAAEAINEIEGPTQEAYNYINQVRARARNGIESDLPNLSGLSKEEFRTAVWKERRFELAFEGQRAWDLKRTGRFLETLRAQGKSVQDYMLLFPIPGTQIELNPNLEQNPGWE